MSRLSSTDHHHHHHSHAEGDGVSLHPSNGCSTRDIREASMRLFCQGKLGRGETALDHRAHEDDHVNHSQLEPDQGSCRDNLYNHGTRNSKTGRNTAAVECRPLPLLSKTRESQGDGLTREPRRVDDIVDHKVIDSGRKKLKARAPTDGVPKRSRKHTHSSGEGAFTSSKNERDAKSSGKWLLYDSGVPCSTKGNIYVRLHRSESEEEECGHKQEQSSSSTGNGGQRCRASDDRGDAGRSRCHASEDHSLADLTIYENQFLIHGKECVFSERSSSNSISVHESPDLNVLIKAVPDNETFSRLKFHKHDLVNFSRMDNNLAKSDILPSDPSFSDAQLAVYSGNELAAKYHKSAAASLKMMTDAHTCSKDTNQLDHGDKNLHIEMTHRSDQNVDPEKMEKIVEKTANPSAGILPGNESRHTDRSQCSDATLPTIALAVPNNTQQLYGDGDGASSKIQPTNAPPPSRESNSEGRDTADPLTDDLKSEYTKHQGFQKQCIQANQHKWACSFRWPSDEYIPETKAIETNSNKEEDVGIKGKSFDSEERTAVTGMKRTKPSKSPTGEHNSEARERTDSVKRGRTLESIAIANSTLHESGHYDESDTETLDSKSRRLLHQLQMVQICKRKANVLLKHVQSIIDGSHPLGDNHDADKTNRQCIHSKNPELGRDDAPSGSRKHERKPRPKSESPERLHRKSCVKTPFAKANENAGIADERYMSPLATRAASKESTHLNPGCLKHETWTDYTKGADTEMNDKKHNLGKAYFLHKHGEEVQEYYKRSSPNTFDCQTTKHRTTLEAHPEQQQKTPTPADKRLAPSNETERKADECGFRNSKSARETYSCRDSPDSRQPPAKYAQWISSATLHGTVTPMNYYDNVSNTSESVDSFFVYNDGGTARYHNSRHYFARDGKYYNFFKKRSRNTFTRSRSANPHTCRRQSGLDYQHKIITKGKRYKISRSSMRQSLKEAIKSAKQSISAAAKVAEALSFVVKASTDSSTSLSSEAGKCPVWQQHHNSTSPAPRANPADSTKSVEPKVKASPQSPIDRSSAWPNKENQLYARSFQESTDLPQYRREKKTLPSPLEQGLNGEKYESSGTTNIRNDPLQYFPRRISTGQNLRESDEHGLVTPQSVSHGPPVCADNTPYTWDGAQEVSKYFVLEGARAKEGPVYQPVPVNSPVLSPKITVQITISKSPESSPQPNVNYPVDKTMHRQENPSQESCLMAGRRSSSNQRPLLEYEQSSELTLSKENWTVSHSCCSSIRKVGSYFNDVNPSDDPLLRDYSSPTRRPFHRHMMDADGSANNDHGDVKFNANVNRSPVSRCSVDNLTHNSGQLKMGEKGKGLSIENHHLFQNEGQAGHHHDNYKKECNHSELMLSHLQNCPMNPLYNTSKRPKPSKASHCLNRSYNLCHTAPGPGKVNSGYQSLGNQFYNQKVNQTGEYLHDAQGKSPEASAPACYSDPSSPCIFHREFEGLSINRSRELRSIHEICNQQSHGATRQSSSVNRQYTVQCASPRQSFFSGNHPDLSPSACNMKSYLEYESERGQTTVYLEIEPSFLAHSANVQASQIPQFGAFPSSGANSGSIGFTAIHDKVVLPSGDVEGTSCIWDNWPHNQLNDYGNGQNVNNNGHGDDFSKDDTDNSSSDSVSVNRDCLVFYPIALNTKMVAGSRPGLGPEAT